MDLTSYFLIMATLIPIVTAISEAVSRKTNAAGFFAQLQTWLISWLVSFFAYYFRDNSVFSFFVAFQIWPDVITFGFLLGLTANGFFDISWVQKILEAVKIRPVTNVQEKNP